MNNEEFNARLDTLYARFEGLHPDHHIDRVYMHDGYSWEEMLARLRAIMILFGEELEKQGEKIDDFLEDFKKELDEIKKHIDETLEQGLEDAKKELNDKIPDMMAEIISEIEKKLPDIVWGSINAELHGIPVLDDVINHDGTLRNDEAMAMPFAAEVKLARNSNMQAIGHDANTGQWFISQVDGATVEGFLINRVSPAGKLLSTMWIKRGGHGSSLMFTSRNGKSPQLTYHFNGQFYSFDYQDDVTVDAQDFFPSLAKELTFLPAQGLNGMPAFAMQNNGKNGLFAVQQIMGGVSKLAVDQAIYDETNGQYTFAGKDKGTVIDTPDWVNTTDSILQGIEVMPKGDISGEQVNEDFYVMISASGPTSPSGSRNEILYAFEYIVSTNELKFLKKMENLANTVHPILDMNNWDWQAKGGETEGLTRIALHDGGRVSPALAFGMSIPRTSDRRAIQPWKNYIFMFGNQKVTGMMTSALSTAITTNPEVNRGTPDFLWKLTEGEYDISSKELAMYEDAPKAWRGVDSTYEWTLLNTLSGKHGDHLQKLILRGHDYPTRTYVRHIDYRLGEFGADYKPTVIEPWTIVDSYGQFNARPTGAQQRAGVYKKLSDITEGGSMFVPGKTDIDLEGLSAVFGGRDFILTNKTGYQSGTSVMQEATMITTNAEFALKRAVRHILGTPDKYGQGFSEVKEMGPWTVYEGKKV